MNTFNQISALRAQLEQLQEDLDSLDTPAVKRYWLDHGYTEADIRPWDFPEWHELNETARNAYDSSLGARDRSWLELADFEREKWREHVKRLDS